MIYRRSSVIYNSKTGVFYRERAGACVPIRSISYEGYPVSWVDNKQYRLARLAWELVAGEPPEGEITYHNGDKTDLRIANLSLVTRKEIVRRRGPNRHSKTGFKGIYPHCRPGKYIAYGWRDYKRYYLGIFTTIRAAADAQEEFRASACRM